MLAHREFILQVVILGPLRLLVNFLLAVWHLHCATPTVHVFLTQFPCTRPQRLSVVLDTGSTDLWVATTSCTICSSGTTLFNPANSSTFKSSTSQVSISYGSGQVSGTVAEDTVSMGGFTIGNQTLCSFFLSGILLLLTLSDSGCVTTH